MPADHSTDIALLKYQQQQTTELLTSLSTDVREMKEALLLNIASNKSQDVRHAEYETRFARTENQVSEHRAFINKLLGGAAFVNLIGLPALLYAITHVAK